MLDGILKDDGIILIFEKDVSYKVLSFVVSDIFGGLEFGWDVWKDV